MLTHNSHCFTISYLSGAPSCISPALALQDFPNNPCWDRDSSAAAEREARVTFTEASPALSASFNFPQTGKTVQVEFQRAMYSVFQIVGKHHILSDKEAQTTLVNLFSTLELRPREWTHRPCDQSLGNVIMNTVSLLSKQGTGQAASGADCLLRCECVCIHALRACIGVFSLCLQSDSLAEDYNIKPKLQEGFCNFWDFWFNLACSPLFYPPLAGKTITDCIQGKELMKRFF